MRPLMTLIISFTSQYCPEASKEHSATTVTKLSSLFEDKHKKSATTGIVVADWIIETNVNLIWLCYPQQR